MPLINWVSNQSSNAQMSGYCLCLLQTMMPADDDNWWPIEFDFISTSDLGLAETQQAIARAEDWRSSMLLGEQSIGSTD